ncbi:hypothetical protein CLV24_1378 [Pontibacter ummariensis]|uniref:Uncharacterized protein n=1 Tax=Pontibacter ummariensis TaxID=1610492 RepID=A0A239LA12_9BACT|nr:hypothetical protein [Pontibacter ummariensis]PRY03981.1 hypothetical protein CLV24_1378 [Pontibacter ummariensis]SNT26374.1 hypothetical protein SAMN06296052_1378 [Pontibacter ummariensis]
MKHKYLFILCSTVLSLVLYNCSDKDAVPPEVDYDELFESVTLPTVVPGLPTPVQATPGELRTSAKAKDLFAALGNSSGRYQKSAAIAPEVEEAATAVLATLSAEEIETLQAMTSAEAEAMATAEALPAPYKAILDKMRADATLAEYFTTYTLPTVGAPETYTPANTTPVDRTLGFEGENSACMQQAQTSLDEGLKRVDAKKEENTVLVEEAYATAIAAVATEEQACQTSASTAFDADKADYQAQYNENLQTVNGQQEELGANYAPIKALLNALLLDYLRTVHILKTAEQEACAKKAEVAEANAEVAKSKNLDQVEATYQTGVLDVKKVVREQYNTCHNQGGGQ